MAKGKTNDMLTTGIAENLKKGITEMLILAFLNQGEMTINSIVKKLDECSDERCKITFPYATIYRLLGNECIAESENVLWITAVDSFIILPIRAENISDRCEMNIRHLFQALI